MLWKSGKELGQIQQRFATGLLGAGGKQAERPGLRPGEAEAHISAIAAHDNLKAIFRADEPLSGSGKEHGKGKSGWIGKERKKDRSEGSAVMAEVTRRHSVISPQLCVSKNSH